MNPARPQLGVVSLLERGVWGGKLCYAMLLHFLALQSIAKQCNAKQCKTMQINAKQCKAMQSSAKQCKAMQSNAKQCKAMQSNAKQCEARQRLQGCQTGSPRNKMDNCQGPFTKQIRTPKAKPNWLITCLIKTNPGYQKPTHFYTTRSLVI